MSLRHNRIVTMLSRSKINLQGLYQSHVEQKVTQMQDVSSSTHSRKMQEGEDMNDKELC